MNHFLNNLIFRNQAESTNLEGRTIVQPRPRSRFESNSNLGTPTDQHSPDTESMTMATSNSSSVTPKMGPRDQTNADKKNKATNHQAVDDNNFISALKQPAEQTFIPQKTSRIKGQTNAYAESVSKTEPSTQFDEQAGGQKLSSSEELNQRIQTIMQHLNAQQTQRTGEPSSTEIHQHTAFFNAADAIDKKIPTESPFEIEPAVNVEQTGCVKQHGIDNRARQRKTHQSGSLQTPNWLTEMQSALNSRLREMNTQEKSEPTVNVTIGRVEVRAVHKAPAKQTKLQNKPSGIMSLDDYLEQRNKGQS